MLKIKRLIEDTRGDATVVEAAILFPIIIMIFAALVLLSMYLPIRATLQRATQYAATAIATEKSDTWLNYDEGAMAYTWETNKDNLDNVYVVLLKSIFGKGDVGGKTDTIVRKVEESGLSITSGGLAVKCGVVNHVIYKEVVVEATRTVAMPVDLSFVKFPKDLSITVASTATVQNGEEFVRSVDIAVDVVHFVEGDNPVGKVFQNVIKLFTNFASLMS